MIEVDIEQLAPALQRRRRDVHVDTLLQPTDSQIVVLTWERGVGRVGEAFTAVTFYNRQTPA